MASPKYCSQEYVKTITQETIPNDIILAAENIVEERARARWVSTLVENEYYSGDGTAWLELKHAPIIAVTAGLIYDSNGILYETVDTDDLLYMRNIGKVFHNDGSWIKGKDNVIISYTWGYTICPEEVKVIIARVALNIFANPLLAKSESLAGASVNYSEIDSILNYLPRRVEV